MNLADFTPADISRYAFALNAGLATKLETIIAPEIQKTSKKPSRQQSYGRNNTVYDKNNAQRVEALNAALAERNWQTAKELQPVIGLTTSGVRSFMSYQAAENGVVSKIVAGRKYYGLPDE